MAAEIQGKISVQCDWETALNSNEGKAWLSLKLLGKSSLDGEIISQGRDNDGLLHLVPSEGLTISDVTKRSFTITSTDHNLKTKFVSARTSFPSIHQKSVQSLDISPGGDLGVSAGSDGHLRVWQTSDGVVRRELEGHAGDVSTCQFFPSGIVILSGGYDTQLNIWSAQDGSCPVTLRGHSGGIRSTDIIDRGRNIVSCSSDGSARLWDCGESLCLDTLYKGDSCINDCTVGIANNAVNLGLPGKPPSEREVGTEGKMLVLAQEDKHLQAVGIHSRSKIFSFGGTDAFNCCEFLSSELVLAGSQDGRIYVVDIRNTSEPYKIIHRSASPVLCLKAHKDGFLAGTADGSSFFMKLDSDLVEEFTGPDCDPIYSIGCHDDELYTACRDHIIRKYIL